LEKKYQKLPEPVQVALKTPKEQRTEAQKLQAEQAMYSTGGSDAEILKELPAGQRKEVENQKIDPDNRLLWKMPLRRLEGEAVRDSILAVAGSLSPKLGGSGVFPEVDAEILKGAAYQVWPKTTDGPEVWRCNDAALW
jgi:hypothetical protein